MKPDKRDSLINWGLLLLLGIIWGFSFLFIKRGLVAYPADQVGALRILLAFISMLPIVFVIGFKIPKNKIPYLILSAMLGSGVPPFLFAVAQTKISSSVTGILNSLTPLFTLIAGTIIFNIKIRRHHALGVAAGLAGSIIVVVIRSDGSFEFNYAYAILVIIATAFYGTNANIIRSGLHSVHPIQIALVTFCFLGPAAGAYLLTTEFVSITTTHPYALKSLAHIAVLSFAGTSYALVLFNYLAHRTTALFATMVTYIIPVVAVIIGVLDGEQLGVFHFIGLGLILAGVYVATLNGNYEEEADVKEAEM